MFETARVPFAFWGHMSPCQSRLPGAALGSLGPVCWGQQQGLWDDHNQNDDSWLVGQGHGGHPVLKNDGLRRDDHRNISKFPIFTWENAKLMATKPPTSHSN